MYNLLMDPPYCTSQGKAGAPPYLGNHWVLVDHACLLNEANSLLCRAVTYIKLSLLKLKKLSIYHTAKSVNVNYLELQIWHSKLLQSIMFR